MGTFELTKFYHCKTRDGRAVRILTRDKRGVWKSCIVALVRRPKPEESWEDVELYDYNGRKHEKYDTALDLIIK